jgi:hypothetical protein
LDTDSLPLLVAAVPGIVDLKLSIGFRGVTLPPPPPPPPALGALTTLHELRALQLLLLEGMMLTSADVAASLLQLPPQLRVLSIACRLPPLRIDRFSDIDFAALVGRLPRLIELKLGVVAQLTGAAFRIAGEACRDLEKLALECKCYLSPLEGSHALPLFPRLNELSNCQQPHKRYWERLDWM